MEILNTNTNKRYYNVLTSDGKFHRDAVGDEKYIIREVEKSDGSKVTKKEVVVDGISGIITNIYIKNTTYGDVIAVCIDYDTVVNMNIASPFGRVFMEKVNNIDLSKEVKLLPYSFENEDGKKLTGLNIYQGDKKIESYYWNAEKKEVKNGMPGWKEEYNTNKAKMKIFFIERDEFLKGELEKFIEKNKFDDLKQVAEDSVSDIEYGDDDVNVEDIPF